MRILLGGFHQEVNSFAPGRTGMEEYRRKQYCMEEDMIAFCRERTRCNEGSDGLAGAWHTLTDNGAEIVSGGYMSAQPGSIIEQSVLDGYLEHIRKVTKESLPLDGVVLYMHGAAQSEESDDPEGDIISAVREIVGDDVPISVGLDLHANVTKRMVENANTITLYHRYPHVDIWETGERAAALCLGMARGEIHPTMAYVQIPMIIPASAYTTETEPFCGLMERARSYVEQGRILDFSVAQMQPWLDVEDGYSSVLTISEDREAAEGIAKELAVALWEIRGAFKTDLTGVDEILRLSEKNDSGSPVILNDFADSSNAGSAGDSPEVIERILAIESDVKGLMYLNDAEFVAECAKVGTGGRVCAPLGGKISRRLYTPVAVEAKVIALFDGAVPFHGGEADFGASAVVRIRNTTVVVTTQHRYNGDPELYRAFGCEPLHFQMVVVKACTSFRAFYAPLTDKIYPAATKGAATADLRSLPFEKIPRSFYPFCDGAFLPTVLVTSR